MVVIHNFMYTIMVWCIQLKSKYEKGQFFEPMLCEEGTVKDLENSQYVAEPKFDGGLVVAERTEKGFRIYS